MVNKLFGTLKFTISIFHIHTKLRAASRITSSRLNRCQYFRRKHSSRLLDIQQRSPSIAVPFNGKLVINEPSWRLLCSIHNVSIFLCSTIWWAHCKAVLWRCRIRHGPKLVIGVVLNGLESVVAGFDKQIILFLFQLIALCAFCL